MLSDPKPFVRGRQRSIGFVQTGFGEVCVDQEPQVGLRTPM
jgi:hypothetical protein